MIWSIWSLFNVIDEHSLKLTSLYTVYSSYNNQATYFPVLQVYLLPLGLVKFWTVPHPLGWLNIIVHKYILSIDSYLIFRCNTCFHVYISLLSILNWRMQDIAQFGCLQQQKRLVTLEVLKIFDRSVKVRL